MASFSLFRLNNWHTQDVKNGVPLAETQLYNTSIDLWESYSWIDWEFLIAENVTEFEYNFST